MNVIDLCTVTGQIAHQSTTEEFKISSLPSDIWPLRSPESANTGPMIGFQVSHALQKYV